MQEIEETIRDNAKGALFGKCDTENQLNDKKQHKDAIVRNNKRVG